MQCREKYPFLRINRQLAFIKRFFTRYVVRLMSLTPKDILFIQKWGRSYSCTCSQQKIETRHKWLKHCLHYMSNNFKGYTSTGLGEFKVKQSLADILLK